MLFSQRIGKRPVAKALQVDEVDQELRNSLWTIIFEKHIKCYRDPGFGIGYGGPRIAGSNLQPFVFAVWSRLWKLPTDTIPPDPDGCIKHIRKFFFSCEWHEVYDVLQISIETYPQDPYENRITASYIAIINSVLETESSGYRIVGNQVTPVVDPVEVESLCAVQKLPREFAAVETHIRRAIDLFSHRKSPDYPNAVKEATCAIESLAKVVTGVPNATLGQLTSKLSIHPALQKALSQIYGFTSDEKGVRHGSIEPASVDFALAKFFVVSASAFVNYVISKY